MHEDKTIGVVAALRRAQEQLESHWREKKGCTWLEKQLSFIIFILSNDSASLHSVFRKEHTASFCMT